MVRLLHRDKSAPVLDYSTPAQRINSDARILSLFVRLTKLVGLPDSVGQIYGVIFLSDTPVEAAEICTQTGASRGSVSQGLRLLRELGAIQLVETNGTRAEKFVTQDHLRLAVENFVKLRIVPALKDMESELDHLQHSEDAQRPALAEKLEVLRRWNKHGKKLLPLVSGFLRTMPLFTRR
ncbi:MAG: hypothetical protein NTZ01_00570 [Verrucomicrobia bacterium]|nr:hypothetical protein [Verrucomicrobiota bacterium]